MVSGKVRNLLFSVVKRESSTVAITLFCIFFLLSKSCLELKFAVMWRPRNQTSVTALFKNTQILKFKSRLTFPFFAAVNHLSGPLRKQKFPSTGFWKVMVCDLWLADFDPFCAFLCFKVRCSVHDRNDNWWRWKTHLLGRRLNFRVRVFFNYTYIHIPANAQDSTLFHYSVLLCRGLRTPRTRSFFTCVVPFLRCFFVDH